MERKTLVLAGGSAGTHVLAAELGDDPAWDVRVITSRPTDWGRVRCVEHATTSSSFPLIKVDRTETHEGTPTAFAWDDAAEALTDADLVLIVSPASAHRDILERLMPALPRGRALALGTAFAQGGFDWLARSVLEAQPDADALRGTVTLFGLKRYPYVCKVVQYGAEVVLHGRYPKIWLAVDPASGSARATLVDDLGRMFGQPVEELPFVSCSLNMSNQLLHPGLLWGHFHDFVPGETTYPEAPRLYGDATAIGIAELDTIYRDLYRVVRALEPLLGRDLWRYLGVDPMMRGMVVLRTWLFRPVEETAWYQFLVRNVGGRTMRNHGRLRELRVPMVPAPSGEGLVPNLQHRIFQDDLADGLCVVYGLGRIAGLPMDGIGRTIRQQQRWIGKQYLDEDGFGPDLADTNAPQRYGVTTTEGLVELLAPLRR